MIPEGAVSGGEIAGIVVAVLITIVIIVTAAVLFLRKKGVKMSEIPQNLSRNVRAVGGGFDNPGYGADRVTLDDPQADTDHSPVHDCVTGASSL